MADETDTTSTETAGTETESATDTVTTDTGGQQDQLGEGGAKALAEERRQRNAAEKAGKAATRERDALKAELDKLRQASMSEQEKAVAEAEARGRAAADTEAKAKFGGRLVTTELRAALAGRMDDAQRDALIEGIDLNRFLGEGGEVDTKAIAKLADALAPKRAASFDSGARGGAAKNTDMSALIRERANR